LKKNGCNSHERQLFELSGNLPGKSNIFFEKIANEVEHFFGRGWDRDDWPTRG
jgi:hypothetical protein